MNVSECVSVCVCVCVCARLLSMFLSESPLTLRIARIRAEHVRLCVCVSYRMFHHH